jgi:hypothetical protein
MKYILITLALLLMASCKPVTGEPTTLGSSRRLNPLEYKGHTYLIFTTGGSIGGITHSMTCKCLDEGDIMKDLNEYERLKSKLGK